MHRTSIALAGVRTVIATAPCALVAWAVLAMPTCCQAQTSVEELAGAMVVSVRCVAEHPLSPEMIPPLATRAGARFDPRIFADDVARLRGSQRFVDVLPYFLMPETGGVELVLDLVGLKIAANTAVPQRALFPAPPTGLRLQSPDTLPEPDLPELVPTPRPPTSTGDPVIDVRIEGQSGVPLQKIMALVRTRTDRDFDQQTLEDDVRRLSSSRMFLDVKARSQRTPSGGVIVTIKVVERPVLKEIKFIGNKKIKAKKLTETTDLKIGKPLDPYSAEEARKQLEDLYKEKGYNATRVELIEGNKIGDTRAVFLINEGAVQRVWGIRFVGHTVVSAARLETQIQTKRPILWVFKGFVDMKKIDGDVDRLTAYYRGLGFFQARIGRELDWNEEQSWLTLTFVIDEGLRYKVRKVSVTGNLKFPGDELLSEVQLKAGEYFDQPKMNADVARIQDYYGGEGYIFANVQADPQFFEEPGELDLVYSIEEGQRYRVGRIEVQIGGEFPHTRVRTVLNRLSLRPGDVVDTRELRNSERRLKASQLFNVDPTKGMSPKIVLTPPDDDESAGSFARRPNTPKKKPTARGQSPDPEPMVSPPPARYPPQLQPPQQPYPARQQQPLPPIPRPPVFRGQSPSAGWDDDAPTSPARSLRSNEAANDFRPNWQPTRPRRAEEMPPATASQAAYRGNAIGGSNSLVPPIPRPPTQQAGDYPRARFPTQQVAGVSPTVVRGQSPGGTPAPNSELWSGYPDGRSAAPRYGSLPPGTGRTVSQGGPPTNPAFVPPGYAPSASQTQTEMLPPPGYAYPPPGGGPLSNAIELPPANSYEDITAGGGSAFVQDEPQDPLVTLNPQVDEARTGRLMFGVGVNSDAGVVGSVVLEEQNFDIMRPPASFQDFIDGTAFRGAGQRFRIEAVPGTQVQRYMFNFTEPYLFDTPVSFGLSAFFYNRAFRDWTEQRMGGQMSLGYQLTPDLSVTASLRPEDVKIYNARVPTPPDVQEVLGHTDLYTAKLAIAHDTRDSTFLPTEGHLVQLAFEQGFGEFSFPRGTLDIRQYFLMRQRADGSGRHVLAVSGQVGATGSGTPVFENFFAGGTTTLRGFSFRGASPVELGTIVGGELQLLGSVEYLMPLTADDALRAVFFCDFGTVEEKYTIDWNDFRVAPGFGLRVTVPALGPAPIALDLTFPVNRAETDNIQQFSFRVGLFR